MVLALVATALAIGPKTKTVSFFDNFDSPPSTGSPVVPTLALVDGTAGGALYYNAFSYAQHNATSITLVPNTPPYNIGSGVTAQLQEETPGWKFQNSSILSFTEHTMYYSCQVYDAIGQPAVPETCMIQATGTTTTGKKVRQNLVYTPASLLIGSTFTKGTFLSNFTGLVDVTFGVVPQVLQAVTVIISIVILTQRLSRFNLVEHGLRERRIDMTIRLFSKFPVLFCVSGKVHISLVHIGAAISAACLGTEIDRKYGISF